MRLNFTFLKQGQLLPEKQIFGRLGTAGFCRQQQEPSKVNRRLAKTLKQVNELEDQPAEVDMIAQDYTS